MSVKVINDTNNGSATIKAANVVGDVNITLPSVASTLLADAGSSLSSNGYQKFSNGLIFQWGTVTGMLTNSANLVTLPIPFTTAVLNITASMKVATAGSNDAGIWVYPTSLSQITVSNENSVTSDGYWFAIGY